MEVFAYAGSTKIVGLRDLSYDGVVVTDADLQEGDIIRYELTDTLENVLLGGPAAYDDTHGWHATVTIPEEQRGRVNVNWYVTLQGSEERFQQTIIIRQLN